MVYPNLHLRGGMVVSFAAVIRVVTQRFSPVTTLLTATKETRGMGEGRAKFLLALYFTQNCLFVKPLAQKIYCFVAIARVVLTFLQMLIRECLYTASRLHCFCCSFQCCFV